MKKLNSKKSILERGGLMIEALAMLGLIAVVTPTMYKKSAERTMEVEDINTASAIRTYMNALNSLVEANYIELMEGMELTDENTPKIATLDSLLGENNVEDEIAKYLPYNFTAADNLYNYGSPKYAVVRSGNNLTAFVLFPAKANTAADSIGQERTVRIASLVGSNGGYVRNSAARGVGGVWSLSSSDLSTMFGTTKDYSLITSSIDAINNSTSGAGEDQTKYLQRTKENDELWRNTMRTDIYMGDLNREGDDNGADYDDPNNEGYYSIYNINRLMVGADADSFKTTPEGASEATNSLSDEYRGDKNPATYGLFIADNNSGREHGINAYIAGSIEAAARKFFVNEEELDYDGPKIQLGQYKNEDNADQYLIYAHAKGAKTGTTTNGEETVDVTAEENLVKIMEDQLVISNEDLDSGLSDALKVRFLTDEGELEAETSDNPYSTKVLVASGGTKGFSSSASAEEQKLFAPKYREANAPKFPVMVDSNMMVNGVMAAGQVDTQHLRAASFSAGSQHIDDEKKWMDVDKDGVHIHNRNDYTKAVDADGTETGSYDVTNEMEVNNSYMAMRFGSNGHKTSTTNSKYSTHDAQVSMDDKGVTIAAFGTDIPNSPAEGVSVSREGGTAVRDKRNANNRTVDITTGTVNEHFEQNEIVIGNPRTSFAKKDSTEEVSKIAPYQIEYLPGGFVHMTGTTLHVTDYQLKPVLSVSGNPTPTNSRGKRDSYIGENSTDNGAWTKFKIAAHGNTIFTSEIPANAKGADANNVAKYLAMGSADVETSLDNTSPYSAAVNIVNRKDVNGVDADFDFGRRIIFIDMDGSHDTAYTYKEQLATKTNPSGIPVGGNPRKMDQGSIYIRKGLIDITAAKPHGGVLNSVATHDGNTADEAMGTVRASRLVANNVDNDGNQIEYTSPVNSSEHEPGGVVKYDRYMVNPAYTSVMKDIKLTSRLGARLSDILPDYITKGIYIASNTYGEGCWDRASCASTSSNASLAGPFLEFVPAPQCPPGYGRAVLINAGTFRMAEAGIPAKITGTDKIDVETQHMVNMIKNGINGSSFQLSKIVGFEKYAGGGRNNHPFGIYMSSETIPQYNSSEGDFTYYANVDMGEYSNNVPAIGKIRGGNMNAYGSGGSTEISEPGAALIETSHVNLNAKKLLLEQIGLINDMVSSPQGSDGAITTHSDPIALRTFVDHPNIVVGENNSMSIDGYYTSTAEYFLTADNIYTQPITLQKSTWLHTQTNKVDNGNYTTGWNAYMGFIYPVKEYGNSAIQGLGMSLKTVLKEGGEEFWWNVFPVLRGSLHAHVTTYCFIDNQPEAQCPNGEDYCEEAIYVGGTGKVSFNDDGYSMAGNIKYNKMSAASSYQKANTNAHLNDPALKYNEVW